MNTFKKGLLSFILLVVAFFGYAVVNAETAPTTLKITHSDYKTPISFPRTFHVKKTVDGKYVYCATYDKTVPVSSVKYTNTKSYDDAGINYILEQGYSAKNNNDYFVVQTAYWIYLEDSGFVSKSKTVTSFKNSITNSSNEYATRIKDMVKKAKSIDDYDLSGATLEIDDRKVDFTLSDDGNYYVSEKITVKSSEDNVEFGFENAPSGTKYDYKNGKIVVSVPASSVSGNEIEFMLKASNSKVNYKSYEYSPNNSKYQVMSATYKVVRPGVASRKLSIKVNKIIISKQDVTSKTELPGATLEIRDFNDNVVEKWVSKSTPHEVTLSSGTYTLVETIAPSGYELSSESKEFVVNADGTADKVVMYNTPIKKESRVSISKLDLDSKDFVAGATLEIRDENGNVVKKFTSGTNAYVITGLKPGKYVLVETVAPSGYELSSESKEFTILEDSDELVEVVMYNKKQVETPQEVAVPATGKKSTIMSSLIGFIVLSIGSVLITKKIKKNEI